MRTLEVDALGIGLDYVGGDVSRDFKDLAVVFKGIFEIDRRIIIGLPVGIAALLELDNPFHKRMMKMELEFRIVAVIICHISYLLFCL